MRADQDKKTERTVDRRAFIAKGLAAGGAIVGAGLAASKLADATDGSDPQPSAAGAPAPAASAGPAQPAGPGKPNILVILVDQMRFPQWIESAPGGPSLPPNLQRLSHGAVSFERHYTASNDCTPARSTLLTGLYTHQTGCMITGGSTLDPEFPTWGTMLREQGYHTRWYGKWHLTHGDNRWTPSSGPRALERYGFAGGTFPSPDGAPGQGWRVDPEVVEQFEEWYAEVGESRPWCTTVSLVNPHDIAWWYSWTGRVPAEAEAPAIVRDLPPNFETPEELIAHNKPRLQRSLQETAASSFGEVPFTGPEVANAWLPFLDLYMKLQLEVDGHIGRILDTLESRPEIAENTVIVFTSDHGEYGASHGLRGKGAGAYEEAIKVPLLVKDPRGILTTAPERTRTQLTSSVDIAPLLLTIGSGSAQWRGRRRYAHLAHRCDLAQILADPTAPGRPYSLHATDEIVTEFAIEPYSAYAPLHVVAMRAPHAKYATYSNWPEGAIVPLSEGQERELYDYTTHSGRLELENSAGQSPIEGELHALLARAYASELRGPLPVRLHTAHRRGFTDYFAVATRAAVRASRRRAEREFETLTVRPNLRPRARRARAHKRHRQFRP